jgi:uncharacterized transporter YbjL
MGITGADIGGLLKTILEHMLGKRVRVQRENLLTRDIFHISTDNREAVITRVITRNEIEAVMSSNKRFIDLFKQKLDL